MSRLVVISNRVQSVDAPSGNQGGLAVALLAALREKGGVWFGWSGSTTETFTGHINFQQGKGVTTATIDLEEQDFDEYYNGYANRTLWPLFHYRIDLTEFERDFSSGYARVNKRFAETVLPLIEPEDLVWVHDYHHVPLGQELRKLGVENKIGFFLHIPWPPMAMLLSLPSHRALVESMFAYDVIGFQTQDWLDSFLHYVTSQLDGVVGEDGWVTVGDRTIKAITTPIGIETADFEKSANSDAARHAKERMYMSATGPQPDRRGRPARLFEGARRAVRGLRALPRVASGSARAGLHAPDRAALAREGRHVPGDPREPRFDVGADQRRIFGHRLDADPLRQPGFPARRAGRDLSRGSRRVGDAVARWDEPGREGICRGAGSRGSGRAGAVALCGRGDAVEGRGAGQSVQPRGNVRRDRPRAEDALSPSGKRGGRS